MTKWEYLYETFEGLFGPDAPDEYRDLSPDDVYRKAMNRLGSDGWELVSFGIVFDGPTAVFKRLLPS